MTSLADTLSVAESLARGDVESVALEPEFHGRIESLVLKNFKSYHGVHEIGPFHQFTAVIGPNGSGKSNLLDAVSFVTGLRAQHLRCANLQSLIYGNKRDCSVSMNFIDKDDQEYEFSRAINRDGKSTYSVNGKTVTAQAYDSEMNKFGILRKARNFLVFQGDVASIATKSPKDLTSLIERLSGSDEYRQQYEVLEAEKESAKELVIQNFQKKKAVNQEKTKLKLHKKEAEQFRKIAQDHKTKQSEFMLWRLYHLESRLKKVQQEKLEKEEALKDVISDLKDQQARLNEVKSQFASSKIELIEEQKKLKVHDKSASKITEDCDKMEEKVKHTEHRKKELEKKLDQLNKEAEQRDLRVKQLKIDISDAQKDLAALNKASDNAKETLRDQDLAKYQKLKAELGIQTSKQQQDLHDVSKELEANLEEFNQLKGKKDLIDRNKEIVDKEIDGVSIKIQKQEEAISNGVTKLKEMKATLLRKKKEQEQLEAQYNSSKEELSEIRNKLRDARVFKDESHRQKKVNDALHSMKQHFKGVYGKLSELYTVQKKYQVSVWVAMGNRNRHAVVTDTQQTAINCIQYLKELHVPPMVFLPLDTIEDKKLNENLRNIDGNDTKLVYDVIQFQKPEFEVAIRFAVGNTVLCEGLSTLMDIAFRRKLKCVSLDGTIVQKSGFITGGKSEVESMLQEESRNEAELDINALKEKRDLLFERASNIAQQLNKNSQDIEELENGISTFERRYEYANSEFAAVKAKKAELEKQRTSLDQQFGAEKEQFDALQKENENLITIKNEILEQIRKEEDGILGEFYKSIGYNIREYEEQQQKVRENETAERRKLQMVISRCTSELNYEEAKVNENELKTLQTKIDEDKELLKSLKTELKKRKSKTKNVDTERKKILVVINNIKKKMLSLQKKINKALGLQKNENEKITDCKRSVLNCDNQVSALRTRREQIMRQCELEEIDLPTISGEESEQVKKKRRVESSEETPSSFQYSESFSLSTEGESTEDPVVGKKRKRPKGNLIRLDFTGLDSELLNLDNMEEYKAVERNFEEDLERLLKDIEKLAPSVQSSKKFIGVQQKLTKTIEDFNDAQEKSKIANEKFEKIRQKRQKLFMQAFKVVSESIDSIYKDLTKGRGNFLGGNAFLELETEDNPFEGGILYSVMPPSKRYHTIDQLSGGERSMASLALLFAMAKYRSPPFLILDEVDAAFDLGNVLKLGTYLEGTKENLQFIVISLKDTFFSRADALVGIYKDGETSNTATLDLRTYPKQLSDDLKSQ